MSEAPETHAINYMTRRDTIIAATLIATTGAAHAMRPRNPIDLLESEQLNLLVPRDIGPWRFLSKAGLVVPPDDDLSGVLYAQLLTRTYIADAMPPMMLLIAQSPAQGGVLQVHRPEYCYPAAGFTLSGREDLMLSMPGGGTVPAVAFKAARPGREEQLVYWTRVGHELPTSWTAQRLAVAKANLRGYIPDGMLVRVSTVSTDPSLLGHVRAFARALVEAVEPRLRPAFLGKRSI
jgi:EpsI family protein